MWKTLGQYTVIRKPVNDSLIHHTDGSEHSMVALRHHIDHIVGSPFVSEERGRGH